MLTSQMRSVSLLESLAGVSCAVDLQIFIVKTLDIQFVPLNARKNS
jgi:hypothetical protein